jgi:DcmR-like sensory protein
MSGPPDCGDWRSIARLRFPELLHLHNPDNAQHLVRFYEDDVFVIDNVAYLAVEALAAGASVVILATDSHQRQIHQRLSRFRSDLERLESLRNSGRYTITDAGKTLSQIMIDGSPDQAAFDRTIGKVICEAAEHSTNGFVFVFGEMVALLCAAGNPAAALRLEQHWNDLAQYQRFSLYCAYPLSCFENHQNLDILMRICAEHAFTVPAESSPYRTAPRKD